MKAMGRAASYTGSKFHPSPKNDTDLSDVLAGRGTMEGHSIEDVLDVYQQEAAILARRGHVNEAHLITSICQDITAALDDYLTWLSEANAQLRSGHGIAWLRDKFSDWEAAGHARMRSGKREYRQIIVPQRRHTEDAAA
jgi:hypothetical protein